MSKQQKIPPGLQIVPLTLAEILRLRAPTYADLTPGVRPDGTVRLRKGIGSGASACVWELYMLILVRCPVDPLLIAHEVPAGHKRVSTWPLNLWYAETNKWNHTTICNALADLKRRGLVERIDRDRSTRAQFGGFIQFTLPVLTSFVEADAQEAAA